MRMRASSQRGGCPLSYSRVRASEPTGRHSRRVCGGCFGEVSMNAPDRWGRLLGLGPEDWPGRLIASAGRSGRAGGGGFAPVLRCNSLRDASGGAFDRAPFWLRVSLRNLPDPGFAYAGCRLPRDASYRPGGFLSIVLDRDRCWANGWMRIDRDLGLFLVIRCLFLL